MKKLLPLQNDSQVGIQALVDCQEEITLDNRKSKCSTCGNGTLD